MASINLYDGIRMTWDGTPEELREDTEVTVISQRNGEDVVNVMPLSRLIGMTNGAVLPYLP